MGVKSQKETSSRLKVFSQSMADGSELSFDELYEKVKASEPADPLATRGITMAELDAPLQAHQNEPEVMMAMQELMTGGMQADPQAMSVDIPVSKLTEVNLLMVDELKAFIAKFKDLPGKEKYDVKFAMICLQATLDSRVIAKFGYSSDVLQAATMAKQQELVGNKDFIQSHQQMQTLMEMFVSQ